VSEVVFRCTRWWHDHHRLKGYINVIVDGNTEFADVLKLDSAEDRRAFAQEVTTRLNGSAPRLAEIETRLLRLMEQADAEPDTGKPEGDVEGSTRSGGRGDNKVTRLAALAMDQAQLLHDPQSDAYARLERDGHTETWPVRPRGFRLWLAGQSYEKLGTGVSGTVISDALNIIESEARFTSACQVVHLRFAPDGEGGLYLDLGDSAWRAVHISAYRWTIVANPPVLFRRSAGMLALPDPRSGGDLGLLREFINLPDDHAWALLKAWIAATVRDVGPYPVLATYGEHGAAKSSLQKMLRLLIDPAKPLLRSNPREIRDLAIAARNCWLAAFDNVSHIEPWLSDALCRLSTGSGWATRELYSDLDEVLFEAQRPIALNGITESITRPDLLDRTIQTFLPEIRDAERRQEKLLWAEFERARPLLLGAVLDTVVGALREFPLVSLERSPRMADFAAWAVAAERGRGESPVFLGAYLGARDDADLQAIESSTIGPALQMFVEAELWAGPWEGTAAEFTAKLEEYADEKAQKGKYWPKTPRGCASELRRLAPSLRHTGIAVTFDRRAPGTGRRLIVMERTPPSEEKGGGPPSRPSPPSPGPGGQADAYVDDEVAGGNADFCTDGEEEHDAPGGDDAVEQPSHQEGQPSQQEAQRDDGRDGRAANSRSSSRPSSQAAPGLAMDDDEQPHGDDEYLAGDDESPDSTLGRRDGRDGCDDVPPPFSTGQGVLFAAEAESGASEAAGGPGEPQIDPFAPEEAGGPPSPSSQPSRRGPAGLSGAPSESGAHKPDKQGPETPSQSSRPSQAAGSTPAVTVNGLADAPVDLVQDAGRLGAILPELLAASVIGIDTETTGLDPHTDHIRLVQLATPGRTYIVDAD
jgi:hypothetical protein